VDKSVKRFFKNKWPMLFTYPVPEPENYLETLLAELMSYQVFPFFDVFIFPDEGNSSRNSLQVSLATF
jgi:hypothetical protein